MSLQYVLFLIAAILLVLEGCDVIFTRPHINNTPLAFGLLVIGLLLI